MSGNQNNDTDKRLMEILSENNNRYSNFKGQCAEVLHETVSHMRGTSGAAVPMSLFSQTMPKMNSGGSSFGRR